ncbi:hypothetical protein T492DRAFT_898583, partial [Pavlovales sp. CCMP2436]
RGGGPAGAAAADEGERRAGARVCPHRAHRAGDGAGGGDGGPGGNRRGAHSRRGAAAHAHCRGDLSLQGDRGPPCALRLVGRSGQRAGHRGQARRRRSGGGTEPPPPPARAASGALARAQAAGPAVRWVRRGRAARHLPLVTRCDASRHIPVACRALVRHYQAELLSFHVHCAVHERLQTEAGTRVA